MFLMRGCAEQDNTKPTSNGSQDPESNIMENSVLGIEGENSFGHVSYSGPCSPSDTTHRYIFRVYALDTVLNLEGGADKQNLGSVMVNHVIANGQLIGLYSR